MTATTWAYIWFASYIPLIIGNVADTQGHDILFGIGVCMWVGSIIGAIAEEG